MELIALTELGAGERAELEAALARLITLHDVILWGLEADRIIAEVVIQDEFTHDVVMPWTRGRYLVFDTT